MLRDNLGSWGDWELIELIGEGSFGKVFKARKKMLDSFHFAAVKIVSIPQSEQQLRNERANGMSDIAIYEYFHSVVVEWHSEIKLLETLKGVTNIVSIEDYQIYAYEDELKWDIFIRMELLTQFNEYILEHDLTTKEILKLGIDICQALEYCHKLNIIHRDIKPENIFVSKFGDFKLGDFGISRQLERTSSTMSKKGTNMYMAPEVYKGETYGFTVDIYSLGLVLYKLFNNNKMPFMPFSENIVTFNDRENSIVRRMSGENLPDPVLADDNISKVILKACAYDSSMRYQSVQEFLGELRKLYTQLSDNQVIVSLPKITQMKSIKDYSVQSRNNSNQESLNKSSLTNTTRTDSTDKSTDDSEKTKGIFSSKNDTLKESETTRGIFQFSSKTREEPPSVVEVIKEDKPPVLVVNLANTKENIADASNPAPASPPEKRKKRTGAWIGAFGVLLLAAALFVMQGMGLFSGSPQEVSVPNVVLASHQQAVDTLEGLGLKVTIVEVEDASQPAGTVLVQSIKAEDKVSRGSNVQLTVAKAIAQVTIPDVKGADVSQAKTQLEGLGLTVTIRQTINDAKPLGEVLSQSVSGGTLVNKGTTVELETVIHNEKITVPDTVGKSEAEAKQMLEEMSLKTTILYVVNDNQSAGIVFKQSVAAGSEVTAQTVIELSVYVKSDLIAVPSFSGKTLSTYKADAEKLGFVVTSSESFSDTIAKGAIISVTPKAGTKVSKGSTIAVVVSKGKSIETVKIPAGVGSSYTTFQTNATNAGLIVSKTDKCSNTVASGLILSMNPAEGTTVNKGSTVNVVVSSGVCPWSDWVTSLPSGVSTTTHEIQNKTQYQYRDKETTTSTSSTLSGWIKYDEALTGYGSWSAWSESARTESSALNVETRPIYVFMRYRWLEPQGGIQVRHSYRKFAAFDYPDFYQEIRLTSLSSASYKKFDGEAYFYGVAYSTSLTINEWYGSKTAPYIGAYHKDMVYTSANTGFTEWYSLTKDGRKVTEYRSRAKLYTYYYYRWSSWSAWQDSSVTSSSSREVQTKIVYRYRMK
ncbi:MAG: PASTA domain-containing protein [Erysipelothrix sp.]|nr:PASTA domain-containing protein [Erysipelothrix sp.]